MDTFTIFDEYITLGQLIKEFGLVSTGGQAKFFLKENEKKIFVNTENESRRGKKLYPGDFIDFPEQELSVVLKAADEEQILERQRIKCLENIMNDRRKMEKGKKRKVQSPFSK